MAQLKTPRPVIVIDFGAQYVQLIAKRVREASIYSEIVPYTMPVDRIMAKRPAAIILSGGPASVYEKGAPSLSSKLFSHDVPMLGICYGFQWMTQALGGEVQKTGLREFGATELHTLSSSAKLLNNLPKRQTVWMSHEDSVAKAPKGFTNIAKTKSAPIAAFENSSRKYAGVQFHPEVLHTQYGQKILRNFLYDIAELQPRWTTGNIIKEQVEKIRQRVGNQQVICGLSGGVDSAVAAALVHKAIGDRLTCVFVDHGLLRAGEAKQVEKDYIAATGINLKVIQSSNTFLRKLRNVRDPEKKRKIIGTEFIRVFEQAAKEIAKTGTIKFLVQGTLYPDVVESGHGSGTTNIKSHHNVGGLPENLNFTLIEPLRNLFKNEVRSIGQDLGLPKTIVNRKPFPGPGLAIRIIGEITKGRLEALRAADKIAQDELQQSGHVENVWQFPVVLLADVKSVGVQGDSRSYGHPVVLRPVTSEDAMTADWAKLPYELLVKISNRITNEVPGINRVVLDISSKPPASIEWE